MNILLITDPYPPQLYSISLMMQQLAEDLTLRGNNVTVATPLPRNNLTPQDRQATYQRYCIEKGVHVIRVNTLPLHNISLVIRGISQLLLPYLFWREISRYCQFRTDVVLVYSPPLTFSILGNKIKKRFGARYILNIQDIFPQSAIDLGAMRNGLLIKCFEHMERGAYRDADRVTSHTINSREFLIAKKNVPANKISYIPNWIDIGPYVGKQGTSFFRSTFAIEKKLVFLFAGVIGPAQGLELIIRAAKEVMKVSSEICFLIVGEGTDRRRLMKMVREESIDNVIFSPFVSQEQYPELVREVDVGLVCLSPSNRTPVVPGKVWGYMAASIPIVGFLNRESDGHSMISDAKCGYSLVSDISPERAANFLVRVMNNREKLRECGENGHRYLLANFTREICVKRLIDLIESG